MCASQPFFNHGTHSWNRSPGYFVLTCVRINMPFETGSLSDVEDQLWDDIVVSSTTQQRHKHNVGQLYWTVIGDQQGHDGPTNKDSDHAETGERDCRIGYRPTHSITIEWS